MQVKATTEQPATGASDGSFRSLKVALSYFILVTFVVLGFVALTSLQQSESPLKATHRILRMDDGDSEMDTFPLRHGNGKIGYQQLSEDESINLVEYDEEALLEYGWHRLTHDGEDLPKFASPPAILLTSGSIALLRGVVGGVAEGHRLFTLPEPFRPARVEVQPCATSDGRMVAIELRPSGSAYIHGEVGDWLSLDGVTYLVGGESEWQSLSPCVRSSWEEFTPRSGNTGTDDALTCPSFTVENGILYMRGNIYDVQQFDRIWDLPYDFHPDRVRVLKALSVSSDGVAPIRVMVSKEGKATIRGDVPHRHVSIDGISTAILTAEGDWEQAPLAMNISPHSGYDSSFVFGRESNGLVRLQGILSLPGTDGTVVLGYLPLKAQPHGTHVFPVLTGDELVPLYIYNDGRLEVVLPANSTESWVSLDGVAFPAKDLVKPLHCLPGQFVDEASGQCLPCAAGTFGAGGFSTTCQECPESTYAASEGHSQCHQCVAGTYSHRGAMFCLACPEGTYSPFPGTSIESCRLCPAGTYSLGGTGQCTGCPAGTFSAKTGSTNCLTCRVGAFSRVGSAACEICPFHDVNDYKHVPTTPARNDNFPKTSCDLQRVGLDYEASVDHGSTFYRFLYSSDDILSAIGTTKVQIYRFIIVYPHWYTGLVTEGNWHRVSIDGEAIDVSSFTQDEQFNTLYFELTEPVSVEHSVAIEFVMREPTSSGVFEFNGYLASESPSPVAPMYIGTWIVNR